MTEIFRGYIQTSNKKSVQKFGHGEPLLTLADAMQFGEFAGVLGGEYTVIDIDDAAQAKALYKIVCALKLNCRVYRTTRGLHFVFRSNRCITGSYTKRVSALGLTFDSRHSPY